MFSINWIIGHKRSTFFICAILFQILFYSDHYVLGNPEQNATQVGHFNESQNLGQCQCKLDPNCGNCTVNQKNIIPHNDGPVLWAILFVLGIIILIVSIIFCCSYCNTPDYNGRVSENVPQEDQASYHVRFQNVEVPKSIQSSHSFSSVSLSSSSSTNSSSSSDKSSDKSNSASFSKQGTSNQDQTEMNNDELHESISAEIVYSPIPSRFIFIHSLNDTKKCSDDACDIIEHSSDNADNEDCFQDSQDNNQ